MPGIPARCLEFIVLTAARSQEARLTTWGEVDIEGRCWRVHAEHMKRGRVHEVPLCDRAVAILQELAMLRPDDGADAPIFPSEAGTPVSVNTVGDALRAIVADVTCHGMRSTFSDWANDATDYHADVIEHALSHAVKGVRGSYRRATAYEKRVGLMDCRSASKSDPLPARTSAKPSGATLRCAPPALALTPHNRKGGQLFEADPGQSFGAV